MRNLRETIIFYMVNSFISVFGASFTFLSGFKLDKEAEKLIRTKNQDAGNPLTQDSIYTQSECEHLSLMLILL